MQGSSFTAKRIEVDFNFVETGKTLTISGHRVSCQIVQGGLETGVMCSLRIDGMQLSDMNHLSTMTVGPISQTVNTIVVKAGSAGEKLATIFQGGVIEAFADFAGSPETAFVVTALTMAVPGAQPITPTSYPSGATIAHIVQAIASKGSLNFQNNGVTQQLSGSLYFWGTVADQLAAVASASRISYAIANDVVTIWPPGTLPSDESAIEVSSTTGMIGYPAFSQHGVVLKTIFNPNVAFRSTIHLKSEYAPAVWVNGSGQLNRLGGKNVYPPSSGKWVVINVQHDIQAETPGGVWETKIVATRPDFAGSVTFAT